MFRFTGDERSKFMRFGFYSAEMEANVRDGYLAGRRDYETHVQLASKILKESLAVKVVEIAEQFVPDYLDHLEQAKEKVEKICPW